MRFALSVAAAIAVFALLAAPTAAEAGSPTLARIQQRMVMTVGYRVEALPFSFELDGKPVGYSIDLCQRIAAGIRQQLKLARLDVAFVPVTADNWMSAVTDGKVDIECSSTTALLSRMERVDFSLLTFVDGVGLLVQRGGPVDKLGDLGGMKVAVMYGTTSEGVLRAALERAFVNATLVPVSKPRDGVELVQSGAVGAYASDRALLAGLILQSGNSQELAMTKDVLSFEPYAFALPRNDADFRLAVNRVLATLYRTGEVAEIYKKWFGPLGDPSPGLLFMYRLQGLPE